MMSRSDVCLWEGGFVYCGTHLDVGHYHDCCPGGWARLGEKHDCVPVYALYPAPYPYHLVEPFLGPGLTPVAVCGHGRAPDCEVCSLLREVVSYPRHSFYLYLLSPFSLEAGAFCGENLGEHLASPECHPEVFCATPRRWALPMHA